MRFKQQKGLTFIGWVIVLFFLGCFMWTGMVMITIHWERLKVKSALEILHTVSFITKQPKSKIKLRIMKKLSLDYIEHDRREYYSKLIKVDRQEGQVLVSIEYEIRKPLFFSFDLVGKYHDKEKIISN